MPILAAEPEIDPSPEARSRVHRGEVGSLEGDPETWDSQRDSFELLTAWSCLKRIRKWQVPPRWSGGDWFEEIEAETVAATVQAIKDFDPARGVPWGAFLRLRIRRAALARYRREWAYAIRRVSAEALDDYGTAEDGGFPLRESTVKLLQEALRQLPCSDIWLIEGLFWEGKTEANLAVFLGISQQAVNKRKRTILRTLRRLIESLAISTDYEL